MSLKRFQQRRVYLLVGSKAEFHSYAERIRQESGRTAVWAQSPSKLALRNPLVYVAGTGHLHKYYKEICDTAKLRGGFVHQYATPGLIIMPGLEIAHEFAEYLGIDPEWRYEGSQ